MEDLKYLVALSLFIKFGSKALFKLKRAFSNYERAFKASLSELVKAGIDEKIALEFIETRTKINPDTEWEKIEKENIKIVTPENAAYPPLLKEVYDLPAMIYVKGALPDGGDKSPLAVIGSRKVSQYGRQVIDEIVTALASQGITIVSGLALGADACAHAATLQVGGRTIAVLGSGVDQFCPHTNHRLAEQILANNGAVISEFPLGALPLRQNFPMRNRLISGMCLGVLVIEAAVDSGSLITAKLALDQNREVFSIPGSIFSPLCAGTNNLLKMGAHVVTSSEDILDELNLERAEKLLEDRPIKADSPEEAAILKIITREPKHIDNITKDSTLSASSTLSTLTLLEIKGRVKNMGGMMYIVNK
ncbi:MAG TPA: DNA-protecting protein DprA [Candidatus Magasanikbacteria bacterium]|uniref:Protecting protein DprA protein n=2 Tax=Candidatus Magasanikiibacteriota TaxID=1752731 RepID=A0A0G0ZKL4_9BACT|nr:MAG: protecting protein DprA protein [Candidatus Magasanikbacteria bacterium GW2011_GWC2_41_17]KKS13523.1 MAG: protecting protein DprA protein [Candidatus Magasanikbacteria bacterium GW2011_GWA2_41_55]HBV57856.1 DNA-protecting protein DprA [Candidatus Magasanikbacteria bacterium]HBX16268.1 DNA-protecting protein DprA [Candidatus Magasanikbacteria bacterium]